MPYPRESVLDKFLRAGNRIAMYYDNEPDGVFAIAELATPDKSTFYRSLGVKTIAAGDSVLAALTALEGQLVAEEWVD